MARAGPAVHHKRMQPRPGKADWLSMASRGCDARVGQLPNSEAGHTDVLSRPVRVLKGCMPDGRGQAGHRSVQAC